MSALALAALVIVSSTAAAQYGIEAGVARDAKLGTPLECLHVELVDSAGNVVAQTLTDSAGQFQLEAQGVGAFRVTFDLHGWAPLSGPLDTLAEGDFKQRLYPLVFEKKLEPDTTSAEYHVAGWSREQSDSAARRRMYLELVALDAAIGWHHAVPIVGTASIRYPPPFRWSGTGGSVAASFVVDSTGSLREATWHTIAATRPEFDRALREGLRDARWTPARIADHPVCSLVFNETRFEVQNRIGHIIISE
jgi:hypothetical protein